MSMFDKLKKSGVVNKVVAEAKKPENQEKVKAQAAGIQQKYKDWKSKKQS